MEIIQPHSLKIVLTLTIGLGLATFLGYITERIKLSPILGYLIAGFLIGPNSPGFVADREISEQLAEIGVILMMFGVGLHFKLIDLLNVKKIAIPGAIGQTLCATVAGALLVYWLGWSLKEGIIIGLAIGVASTVVLVRVLSSNNLLNTPEGHVAIGWLIVEDILTVCVLVLLPTIAAYLGEKEFSLFEILSSVGLIFLKFLLLLVILLTIGIKIVTYTLLKIARTRSHELFTVAVLSLTFIIAIISSTLFGASIALGAFIAGMIIGQTDVRHQAAANALPLKDAFLVIFFLSVGMLFNPTAIINNFWMFLAILLVILIIKPIVAFIIICVLKHPLKTALTVSIALAQIGEFSFILTEEAMRYNLLNYNGYDLIIACALISISINPLLFKALGYLSKTFNMPTAHVKLNKERLLKLPKAIVVGYGPIGQNAASTLAKLGYLPVIIERNIDSIPKFNHNWQGVFGDATQPTILRMADIQDAKILVITIPDIETTTSIIAIAHQISSKLPIIARARYLADTTFLENIGVSYICCEKETANSFKEAIYRFAAKNLG